MVNVARLHDGRWMLASLRCMLHAYNSMVLHGCDVACSMVNVARCMAITSHAACMPTRFYAPCRTSQRRAAAVLGFGGVLSCVLRTVPVVNHEVACCVLRVACCVLRVAGFMLSAMHRILPAVHVAALHAVRCSAARRRRRRTGGPETSYSFSSPTSRPTQVSFSAREYP
jgi:hypothetical protein